MASSRIRISILSDSRLFRDTIACRLAGEEELELLGARGSVHDLLIQAQAQPIDVLLVHLNLESGATAEVIWDVKALLPAARVIVIGLQESELETLRWIEAGAVAYLDHDASYASLLETIRGLAQGRTPSSLGFLARVVNRIDELKRRQPTKVVGAPEALTPREEQVAKWLAVGLADKQIARRLGIKQPTVKHHVHHVLRKLQVKRRRDVIRRTGNHGTWGEG